MTFKTGLLGMIICTLSTISINAQGDPLVQKFNRLAKKEFELREYVAASVFATYAISQRENAYSHYIRAKALVALKKYNQALLDCDSAMSSTFQNIENGGAGDIFFTKGVIYMAIGQYSKAVEMFGTAESQFTGDRELLSAKSASCYEQLFKWETASQYYGMAIELSKSDQNIEEYWRKRGNCMVNAEKWQLADSFLTKAISFGLQPFGVYWALAKCRRQGHELMDMFSTQEEMEKFKWSIMNCYNSAIFSFEKDVKEGKVGTHRYDGFYGFVMLLIDKAEYCLTESEFDEGLKTLDSAVKYCKLGKVTGKNNEIQSLRKRILDAKKLNSN